jgi:uncharacterized protein (DUF488 family)
MRLFTLGYQQRTLDRWIGILEEKNIDVVVDVRENAWSRKQGFSKSQLSVALASHDIEYIHARFAGNPKRIRDAADSPAETLTRYEKHLEEHPEIVYQLDDLLVDRLLAGQRPCFMCYERHPGDCHRTILLDHWLHRRDRSDWEVTHLAPYGAERFVEDNDQMSFDFDRMG